MFWLKIWFLETTTTLLVMSSLDQKPWIFFSPDSRYNVCCQAYIQFIVTITCTQAYLVQGLWSCDRLATKGRKVPYLFFHGASTSLNKMLISIFCAEKSARCWSLHSASCNVGINSRIYRCFFNDGLDVHSQLLFQTQFEKPNHTQSSTNAHGKQNIFCGTIWFATKKVTSNMM